MVQTSAVVVAVSSKPEHGVWKQNRPSIRILAGLGVEGDAHCGATVKHRSRVRENPDQPNLRQVHLLHSELHDELLTAGMQVGPGDMGENVTTRGVDLLALPTGAVLRIGASVRLEVTGLRNPCSQLDEVYKGLMKATLGRDATGRVVRKAGVMAVVLEGGEVKAGDSIEIEFPSEPHRPLVRV